jgi:holo-[acyl-carrier protein] synthase
MGHWFTREFLQATVLTGRFMIIGIGLDLVEAARVAMAAQRFDDKFLQRVFTPDEVAYCLKKAVPAMHLAGRFAAKEACVKALGCGIGSQAGWREMEVVRDENGKPTIRLSGAAARLAESMGVANIFLSITHTENHASAVVVLEG